MRVGARGEAEQGGWGLAPRQPGGAHLAGRRLQLGQQGPQRLGSQRGRAARQAHGAGEGVGERPCCLGLAPLGGLGALPRSGAYALKRLRRRLRRWCPWR